MSQVMMELRELLQAHNLMFMAQGLMVTIQVAIWSIAIGFVIGLVVGIARYSKMPVVSHMAAAFVEVLRNSPLLLLIFFARFGSGLRPIPAAVAALAIFTGAIVAEVVRGGLTSIDKGQWEAARSQGFTYVQTIRYVVMPQALRKMIPPLAGQFITVIKDTSFLWLINIEEFTGKGMILMNRHTTTVQFFAIFGLIALVFYVLCSVLSRGARLLEKRMALQSY